MNNYIVEHFKKSVPIYSYLHYAYISFTIHDNLNETIGDFVQSSYDQLESYNGMIQILNINVHIMTYDYRLVKKVKFDQLGFIIH